MYKDSITQMIVTVVFSLLWVTVGHFAGTTVQIAVVGAAIFGLLDRLYNKK